jgi:hypothetical protein
MALNRYACKFVNTGCHPRASKVIELFKIYLPDTPVCLCHGDLDSCCNQQICCLTHYK